MKKKWIFLFLAADTTFYIYVLNITQNSVTSFTILRGKLIRLPAFKSIVEIRPKRSRYLPKVVEIWANLRLIEGQQTSSLAKLLTANPDDFSGCQEVKRCGTSF